MTVKEKMGSNGEKILKYLEKRDNDIKEKFFFSIFLWNMKSKQVLLLERHFLLAIVLNNF